MKYAILLAFTALGLHAQGIGIPGVTPMGSSVRSGTSLPAACSPPELFFKTDATPGLNLYGCTSVNNWTVLGDGTGSGSFGETSLAGLVNNQTLWDSSQATRDLTAGLSGATDPIIRFANNSIDLRAGTLLRNGTAVLVSGDPLVGSSASIGSSPPAVTAGTGGVEAMGEGTAPSAGCPAAGVDCTYADSTAHAFLDSYNNDTPSRRARYSDKLSVFAATTSAELAGVLSDESGTTGGFQRNPMTTAGDLTYGGASGVPARLAIGGANTLLHGGASDPSWGAVVNGDLAANAVDSAKMAVVNTRRVCDIVVGDTSGSALANGALGPQKRICFIPAASTVVEINVAADGGTPNVIVAKNSAGSVTNLLSSALATAAGGGIACSKTSAVTCIDGATTASATLQNGTLAAGDYIELVSGTAGGTAKLMTIHVVYTVN